MLSCCMAEHNLHFGGVSLPLTIWSWLFFLTSFNSFTCNIISFSKCRICIMFFFCPERYKCLFQYLPNWKLLYVYFCPAYRCTSCSAFLGKGDSAEGRKRNEPAWAGNNLLFLLKQLQSSTKFLGEVWKYTGCYTRGGVGGALCHKIPVTPYERIGTVVSPEGPSSVLVL